MKRGIFIIFTMLFAAVLVISVIRAASHKTAFDFHKSWNYVTSSNAEFGNIDAVLGDFTERVKNLSWDYHSIDDDNFFRQVGNFFSNIGNFFYNIGNVIGLGIIFIVSVIGYILAFFVYGFKLLKYFLT